MGRGQRQHCIVHQEIEFAVIQAGRHRQVACSAVPSVRGGTAVWPAIFLMDRYGQHPRLVYKCVLDPVTVMCVEVDIQDPRPSFVEERANGKHRIVEIAEAAGPIRPAVMGAPGRVEHDMAFRGQPGRHDRATDRHRGAFEQACKQGIFQRANVVSGAHFRRDPSRGICVLQRLDIGSIMKLQQLIHPCRRARPKIVVAQPTEDFDQIEDGRVAHDPEWMIAAKRGTAIDVVTDKKRNSRSSSNRPDLRSGWHGEPTC